MCPAGKHRYERVFHVGRLGPDFRHYQTLSLVLSGQDFSPVPAFAPHLPHSQHYGFGSIS